MTDYQKRVEEAAERLSSTEALKEDLERGERRLAALKAAGPPDFEAEVKRLRELSDEIRGGSHAEED